MTTIAHRPPSPPRPSWRLLLEELRSLPPDHRRDMLRRVGPMVVVILLSNPWRAVDYQTPGEQWGHLLLNVAIGLMIAGIVVEGARPPRADGGGHEARGLLSAPVFAAASGMCAAAALALTLAAPPDDTQPLVMPAMMVGLVLMTFFGVLRTNRRLYDAAAAEASAAARAQSDAATAKLSALQAQLNPHFLFNTLNTIAALVRIDPKAAERTVEYFADVMGRTLDHSERAVTTLADELAYLRAYLGIAKERFTDRLTVRWDVADDASGHEVPSFVLQPLVENALKHGLAEQVEGGTVTVGAVVRHGRLRLWVEDDGLGFPRRSTEGVGIGNLRKRIEHFAPESGALRVERLDRGSRVIVDLPARLPAPARRAE